MQESHIEGVAIHDDPESCADSRKALPQSDATLVHPTPVARPALRSSRAVTSDYEAWILSVLSRTATTLFEFGTATGRTADLWARNSPPSARVYTITLDRAHEIQYTPEQGDEATDQQDALSESSSERFLYSGTDVEHKVTQLYGDSKDYDETLLLAKCDLIFIDGSHARSYVRSDSEKALRMIKPGGLILWHDYRGPHRSSGMFETLNKLGQQLTLRHIEGTSLVAYRA